MSSLSWLNFECGLGWFPFILFGFITECFSLLGEGERPTCKGYYYYSQLMGNGIGNILTHQQPAIIWWKLSIKHQNKIFSCDERQHGIWFWQTCTGCSDWSEWISQILKEAPCKNRILLPNLQRRSLRREARRALASPAGTRRTGRREGPIAEITIRLIH